MMFGYSAATKGTDDVGTMRVQLIATSNGLYPQAVELRERVLLKPIGYTAAKFASEYPEVEQKGEHFVAVIDHPSGKRVVGTVCLLPNYPERGVGKLTQMVVDEQRQREGWGGNWWRTWSGGPLANWGCTPCSVTPRSRPRVSTEKWGGNRPGRPFPRPGSGITGWSSAPPRRISAGDLP